MENIADLEERVASLERIVANLRQQLTPASGPTWIEKMKGCIKDTEAFDQAMSYGRQYRETGRSPDTECEAS